MFGSFSLFKTPFPGRSSLPTSFVSFFVFYIFSYLFSKTMSCFSGCLMSSAGIQKLFCGIYSALKCSFDEFVGEKVVSPSYSSTTPLKLIFLMALFCRGRHQKREGDFFPSHLGAELLTLPKSESSIRLRLCSSTEAVREEKKLVLPPCFAFNLSFPARDCVKINFPLNLFHIWFSLSVT